MFPPADSPEVMTVEMLYLALFSFYHVLHGTPAVVELARIRRRSVVLSLRVEITGPRPLDRADRQPAPREVGHRQPKQTAAQVC